MRTVKMFEVDEEVMIKVKIASVEIRNGELLYRIKDPKSGNCLTYTYEDADIYPCDNKE